MARVQNTLIGRTSGSVGEVTFLTWKTINVIRKKMWGQPVSNTQPQLNQRQRYGILVNFYKYAAEAIEIGLHYVSKKMSAQNMFLKQNLIPSKFIGTAPTMVFDWPQMQLSKGVLLEKKMAEVNLQAYSTLMQVFWHVDLRNNQLSSDILCILIYNETQNLWFFTDNYIRSEEVFVVNVLWQSNGGDIVHAFNFWKSQDGKIVSPTTYMLAFVDAG